MRIYLWLARSPPSSRGVPQQNIHRINAHLFSAKCIDQLFYNFYQDQSWRKAGGLNRGPSHEILRRFGGCSGNDVVVKVHGIAEKDRPDRSSDRAWGDCAH